MEQCLVPGRMMSISATPSPYHLFRHYVTSERGQDHSVTYMFTTKNMLTRHNNVMTLTALFKWSKVQRAKCVKGVSKSILLVKWQMIWVQSVGHGAKRYLDYELFMGVFWAEHELKQSKSHLPFPSRVRCTRTWHTLTCGTRPRWGKGMWPSSAPPFHDNLSHQELRFTANEKTKGLFNWGGGRVLLRIPPCSCGSQYVDQAGRVIKSHHPDQ